MSSYRAGDWASPQLFALAEAAEILADTLPDGSTERGCIREALRKIELADTYVEQRQRDADPYEGDTPQVPVEPTGPELTPYPGAPS